MLTLSCSGTTRMPGGTGDGVAARFASSFFCNTSRFLSARYLGTSPALCLGVELLIVDALLGLDDEGLGASPSGSLALLMRGERQVVKGMPVGVKWI